MNEIWPIEKLKEWDRNPRSITVEGFDRLKKQLYQSKEEQGEYLYKPLLIDEDGTVLGGNMRLRALRDFGEKNIWVSIVKAPTLQKKLEYALSDNDNEGSTDKEQLLALIEDMPDLKLDEYAVHLEAPESLNLFMAQFKEIIEDEAPPVDDKNPAVSQLGEVYQLGRHRLMCADSTKIEDVEKLMNGQKADMVFTDPPYGVDYDGGVMSKRNKLMGDSNTDLYIPCCLMAYKFSESNAPLYIWHAGVKGISAAAAAAAAGYEIRAEIIWNKNHAQFGALSAQYKQKHEPCFYCFKIGQSSRWIGSTNEVTVWDIDRSMKNDLHPTQKPVALSVRAIKNHDCVKVLDLFGGSGSTLIACEQTNRVCTMMEIDPKYCDVIRKRYAKFINKEDEWQTITPIIP